MNVLLIHGMGRSSLSMRILGRRLARAGHQPRYFDYFVSRQSLAKIAERYRTWVNEASDGEPYAIVGHSFGGILTRYCANELPPGLRAFAMLGPPNQPPSLAGRLKGRLSYRTLMGDVGQHLGDPSFFASLGRPDAPTRIYVGTAGPGGRLPFDGRTNDLVVALDESALEGVPMYAVPTVHAVLMNHPLVAEGICAQLDEAWG